MGTNPTFYVHSYYHCTISKRLMSRHEIVRKLRNVLAAAVPVMLLSNLDSAYVTLRYVAEDSVRYKGNKDYNKNINDIKPCIVRNHALRAART
eukprot:280029-Pleurochrysis_carterae.AAC.1